MLYASELSSKWNEIHRYTLSFVPSKSFSYHRNGCSGETTATWFHSVANEGALAQHTRLHRVNFFKWSTIHCRSKMKPVDRQRDTQVPKGSIIDESFAGRHKRGRSKANSTRFTTVLATFWRHSATGTGCTVCYSIATEKVYLFATNNGPHKYLEWMLATNWPAVHSDEPEMCVCKSWLLLSVSVWKTEYVIP